jgi:hypothetical protein
MGTDVTMRLRRRRLRRNLRALHPIPYLQRKERDEWNATYDEAMRHAMSRMLRMHYPPRPPLRWFKYVVAAAVIGAIVAGYYAGHHTPKPTQPSDSQQTRL